MFELAIVQSDHVCSFGTDLLGVKTVSIIFSRARTNSAQRATSIRIVSQKGVSFNRVRYRNRHRYNPFYIFKCTLELFGPKSL